MRGTVAYIVLSLVTVGVFSGSFYGEKENAVKAVENKLEELMHLITNFENRWRDEKENTETETEDQMRYTLSEELNYQMSELAEKNYKVGAIAVAQGKPLSVINCIMEVQLEAYYTFLKTMDNILKLSENIKARKDSSLKTVLYNARVLVTGFLAFLADKLVEDIKNATSGFQDLQADAIKKIETVKKLLEELATLIPIPELKHEFLALERQIAPKFRNVTDVYDYKSYQCLLNPIKN